MNRFESITGGAASHSTKQPQDCCRVADYKPLKWFTALLLAAFVAGCGGGGTSDTTPPIVSSTFPVNAASGVAVTANATATFSKMMNASTINTTTFTLKQGATIVTGAVSYTGTTTTFNPTSNLAASTTYTATVTTGVKDLAGNALAVKKSWSFNTAADTTPPTVLSTVPASGVANVALAANITATFSKAMDPLTVTKTTFTLMQGVTAISGVVSSPSTKTATFNPNLNLTSGAAYTATISTGVKDLSGNAMLATKTWNFTAGSAVAGVTAPVVLGTAGNYAILAKAGVSTVPGSVVTGNVGVSPLARTYLTGWSETYDGTDTYATSAQVFAPGKLYAADLVGGTTSADLGTAVLDMGIAYAAAAGMAGGSCPTVAGGGMVTTPIPPGVYTCALNVIIPTNITLAGTGGATDVWVFQFTGNLTQANGTQVLMTGGALPQNVFWQVSGAVDIGTTAHMEGVILSQTAIHLRTGASINGRLLAQTAVTLDQSTVTQP